MRLKSYTSRSVLLLILTVLASCRKDKTPVYKGPYSPLAEEHAAKMEGTRNWKVMYWDLDTSFYRDDTTFDVHVVNDTTLNVWGGELLYCPNGLKVDKMSFPVDTTRHLLYGGYVGAGCGALEYYYNEDSIIYYYLQGESMVYYFSFK